MSSRYCDVGCVRNPQDPELDPLLAPDRQVENRPVGKSDLLNSMAEGAGSVGTVSKKYPRRGLAASPAGTNYKLHADTSGETPGNSAFLVVESRFVALDLLGGHAHRPTVRTPLLVDDRNHPR